MWFILFEVVQIAALGAAFVGLSFGIMFLRLGIAAYKRGER